MGERLKLAPEGNWIRYRTEDGFEVLGDGSLLPRSFEACFPDDSGAPELHLRIEMRGGIPQCRGLLLSSPPDDRELRQSDLRSIDIEEFLSVACQLVSLQVTEELEGGGIVVAEYGTDADLARVAKSVSRARRNTRRKIPDDKLHLVAEVYMANPGRPTAAVAEHFHLPLRTASLYVRRARDARLLEENTDGRR
jgi:hypothetical protein